MVVNNNLTAATENWICPSSAHSGEEEIHSKEYKALKMENTKSASTIRDLEKKNVSLIEEKANMDKTSKEMQCNITDCNHTIENLHKLLSKAEDNLKQGMSQCNFADHKIESLHTLFTEANDKLMKAVVVAHILCDNFLTGLGTE